MFFPIAILALKNVSQILSEKMNIRCVFGEFFTFEIPR